MNAARRKKINELASKLEELGEELRTVAGQEADAYDALPESLQQGERGQAMESAIEVLERIPDTLDDLASELTDLTTEEE